MAGLEQKIDLSINISKTAELIDDSWFWKGNSEPPRDYLGVSSIGHACPRYLWLNFRWFSHDIHEGRMLRLFRRGHREEETVVEDLSAIGLKLDYVLDNQLNIDFGSHVKGHPDGLILSGVYEAPKAFHSLEIKTHNLKSFTELESKGVQEAKPMHYAQMQCEMLGTSLMLRIDVQRALYVAVCKDDDRMYTERVRLDRKYAEHLVKRGQDIATSDYIPSSLSDDPDFFLCQFCRFHDFCHGCSYPDINCRTCSHFTAEKNGRCTCACYGGKEIPLEVQRKGCECHVIHPDLVPGWELRKNRSTDDSACYFIPQLEGEVLNGWEGNSSSEILSAVRRGESDIKAISAQSSPINF